jgi:hypothetical protein
MTDENATFKKEALELTDSLPPKATWDDLYYAVYVRAAIEKGVKDLDEGSKVSFEHACKRFGLLP